MARQHIIRGYHATDRDSAERIFTHGFKVSQNEYDWLGWGIYFFQDTKRYAKYWAENERAEGLIKDPVIIGANIEYTGFLDLLEKQDRELLKQFYRLLESSNYLEVAQARARQPQHKPGAPPSAHPLDCLVIQRTTSIADKNRIRIRAIRAIFFEGAPIYQNSHIFDRQHIQIAVRDPTLIVDYWQEN